MRCVWWVSGGGTGGHIYPALAIAKGLAETAGAEILYVGGHDSLEERLAGQAGFRFFPVQAAAVSGRSLKAVGAFYKNWQGLQEAKKLLKEFKPQLVIGTGGYVEVPVVLGATQMRIPTLLHEQNAYPGLANRFLSRRVDLVCLAFDNAGKYFHRNTNLALTGLPVRKEILEAKREDGLTFFGLDGKKPVFLIVGGSQGAKALNDAMAEIWQDLLDRGIQIIQITGPNNYQEMKEKAVKKGLESASGLLLLPYLDQMEKALAVADLVLSRSGASFLAELVSRGIPSILVPYPFAAANHQFINACSLEQAGAAIVIENDTLNGDVLLDAVGSLINNKERLIKMAAASAGMGAPNALANIVGLAIKLMEEKTNRPQ